MYFGIGIIGAKREHNVGTLWRSAYLLGAAFIFTVGRRHKPQASDTVGAWGRIPMYSYLTQEEFLRYRPFDCRLVGVETGGGPLEYFQHPTRAIYLLGAEDSGIPKVLLEQCQAVVTIPAVRSGPYNVATAGALVMFDRMVRNGHGLEAA